MTAEEQAAAMNLLRSPQLLDRILADFARCGVVGQAGAGHRIRTTEPSPHGGRRAVQPHHLSALARDYVEAAATGKSGACHLFRHTMATLMLEGGADIRDIQQMLGHAKLDTSQIFTHVSVRMLKEIHSATHPGAKLEADTNDGQDKHPEQDKPPDEK